MIDLEVQLKEKLGISEIKRLADRAAESKMSREALYEMLDSKDRRVSVNSHWIMTHMPESGREWLCSLQPELIKRLLKEDDIAKKRMLLQLLREQEFDAEKEEVVELLDFCLSKINSECEPYAIRCFSIYTAFKICRPYKELIKELDSHLEMMKLQSLSAGLRSALRQTKIRISKLK